MRKLLVIMALCFFSTPVLSATITLEMLNKMGDEKMVFSEKNGISYIVTKRFSMFKNTTFELLGHHHELNQKKHVAQEFFRFKVDSTMLKS